MASCSPCWLDFEHGHQAGDRLGGRCRPPCTGHGVEPSDPSDAAIQLLKEVGREDQTFAVELASSRAAVAEDQDSGSIRDRR